MRIWPTTRGGSWGLWLTIAFAVFFVLKAMVGIPLPSFLLFGIGIVGVALGVAATIRGDFSWVLIVVGGVIAAFLLFWAGGELLVPH